MWSFKNFSISIGNTEIGSTLWLQWNEIQITKIPWYIVILDSYCKYACRWIFIEWMKIIHIENEKIPYLSNAKKDKIGQLKLCIAK